MELDKIIEKVASLYLGTAIMAVIVAILTLGEPFVILAGIGALGLTTVLGDAIAVYGIEAVMNAVYAERSKKESVQSLLEEIDTLFITRDLKYKLKEELSKKNTTINPDQEVQSKQTVGASKNFC